MLSKVRLIPVVGLLVLFAAAYPAGAEVATASPEAMTEAAKHIKRFVQVDARLYRGEQPDATDLETLRNLGVRTVISLRKDLSHKAQVEALGMKFVHIPITLRPFTFGVTLRQDAVETFFRTVDDPANGIVYIHCRRGADRTGAFVGLYRVLRQQWTPERAFREARDIGMRWWLFRVKDQLTHFAS